MSSYLDALFDVNLERTRWVEEQDLGTEKEIAHRGKRYAVKIPERIEKQVTLRLRGLGRTRNGEIGDLLLHIRLATGDDIRRSLWLSETAARKGTDKTLQLNDRRIRMVVPPGSRDGLVIRLSGLGPRPSFDWRAPFQPRRHGNLPGQTVRLPGQHHAELSDRSTRCPPRTWHWRGGHTRRSTR